MGKTLCHDMRFQDQNDHHFISFRIPGSQQIPKNVPLVDDLSLCFPAVKSAKAI